MSWQTFPSLALLSSHWCDRILRRRTVRSILVSIETRTCRPMRSCSSVQFARQRKTPMKCSVVYVESGHFCARSREHRCGFCSSNKLFFIGRCYSLFAALFITCFSFANDYFPFYFSLKLSRQMSFRSLAVHVYGMSMQLQQLLLAVKCKWFGWI